MTNWQEVEEADKLELEDRPEKVFEYDDLLINPDHIETMHLDSFGEIQMFMVSGHEWTIKFDDKIWREIKDLFANKQINK